MDQQELFVRSTLDDSLQPSLFYAAQTKEKRPLLVGLHTWSHDRYNQIHNLLPYAERMQFNLLLPEFRGPNLLENPNCKQACGSLYAKQDIKDAIDHVVALDLVDTDNIFLVGMSGGGQMALLMAGFCPEYFKCISAFVPLCDLPAWEPTPRYIEHIWACCGSEEEMRKRSPISYLDKIALSNTKIFHGKHDPVVPVSQSILFYNQLIEKYPAASVYLDIFDGGHQFDLKLAAHWIESQYTGTEKNDVTG